MPRKTKVYNPEMLTADTAGAHNSILTVAVRVLLAIFPKAAVLAAFCATLAVDALAQDAGWDVEPDDNAGIKLIIGFIIIFLPTIIACVRKHKKKAEICLCNLGCLILEWFSGGYINEFFFPLVALWLYILVWSFNLNLKR